MFIPLFDDLSEPRSDLEVAVAAEEAGWDGVFVWDHILWDPPVERLADPWVVMVGAMSAGDATEAARKRWREQFGHLGIKATIAETRIATKKDMRKAQEIK